MPLLFPASPSVFPAKSKPYPSKPNLHHQHRPLHLSHRRYVFPPPPASGEVDAFTKYSGYIFENGSSSAETDLPKDYEPEAIAAIYRRKPVLVARRLAQIVTSIGRWFALRYVDRALERSDVMFKVRAAELRMILLQLGPVQGAADLCRTLKLTNANCQYWHLSKLLKLCHLEQM